MKKLLLSVGVLLLSWGVLVGCNSEPEPLTPQEQEGQEEQEEKVEELLDVIPEQTQGEPAEAPEVAKEEEVALYLSIMQEQFSGKAEIEFKEDMDAFTITPTDPAFTNELMKILAGQLDISHWNELVDSMAGMSENLGADYLVVMVNPVNTDNYLLMVGNGIVLYDALNE